MKIIKKIFKSIIVAFSIYSWIPMPHFEWASEDMDYHLIFFPWVGAVIGVLDYLWMILSLRYGVNDCSRVLVAIVIPLIITGGFHVDGFMDTCDALKSYGDRDKKLEILKDPHIGAFSVICLVIYLLLAIALMLEVKGDNLFLCLAFIPAMSRCISGLIVTLMKPAKKDGMLRTSSDNNARRAVVPLLILTLIVGIVAMLAISLTYALSVIVAEVVFLLYFITMSNKKFGGVTGDLAGFYVVMSELIAVAAALVW